MPQIRLDIFAHLHEAQLRRAEAEAKNRFEKMGQQAGEDLTRGIEQAGPKIRRAMNSAADATADYTNKVEAARKAQEDHNAVLERANRLEAAHADLYTQAGTIGKEVAKQETARTEALKAQEPVAQAAANSDARLRQLRAEHAKTLKELKEGELDLKQLRLDGENTRAHELDQALMETRRKSAEETANLRSQTLQLSAVNQELTKRTTEADEAEKRLKELRAEHVATVKNLDSTEKELAKTRETAAKTDDDIIKRNDDVERSHRRRQESLRRLMESEDDDNNRRRGGGGGGGIFGGGGGGGAGGFFRGALPGGRNPGAGVYAAAAPLAGDLAMAAVTASQAIATLPAVAAAGAAGLLTLTVGFSGLDQAIKDMGDPKKFAEDLQTIGPAAQQVALEVQHLAEGPLKELKTAIEDSLFKGIPERLHSLTDTLLPSVRQLTTGVGDAFNNMFGDLSGELTTPESLKAIHEIINNIVTAFHALEPAVAPFVDALTKITQTGSTFLPGFATSIADAARSFDDFITKAQQSGALQEFMQKGVDAVKLLADDLLILGQKIYEIFGNKSPEQFKQLLDDVVNAVITIGQVLEGAGRAVNVFLQDLQKIATAVGGYQNLFEIGFGIFLGGKLLKAIELVRTALAVSLPAAAAEGAGGVTAALAGMTAPAWLMTLLAGGAGVVVGKGVGDDLNHGANFPRGRVPLVGPGGALDTTGNPYGHPWSGGGGGSFDPPPQNTTFNRTSRPPGGAPPPPNWPDSAGIGPYGGPYPVPDVPATGGGNSKTDKITAAREALPPGFGAVDPFAGTGFDPSILGGPQAAPGPGSPGGPGGVPVGGAPGLPPLEYGTNGKPYAKPGYGYESVDQEAILEKAQKLQNDGFDIQQKAMDLEALKRSGVATQKEILEADHQLTLKKQELHKDQLALAKAEEGKWNPVGGSGSSSSKLGPGIDPGFGIAQGLPGLADNLVKFVGSLFMAPVLAALQQITGGKSDSETGYGLIGGLAAQGAFGPDFTGAPGVPGQSSTFGSSAPGSGVGGGYPGDAALLAGVPSGKYDWGGGDLAKGLTDCSGAVTDLVNIMDTGSTTPGHDASTGPDEAQWLTKRGFLPTNTPMPGTFQVGMSGGHTQATLPGGTEFNWGNDADAANRGIAPNSGGAWNPAMTSHFYRPVGGSPGDPAGSGLAGGPAGLSGSGVVPVFVTNMDGGGLGGGGPAVGGAPPGAGPPGPGQGGLSAEQWQKIAGGPGLNESSGNWSINSGNGYSGGLQITPENWKKYGGEASAPAAWQATPEQQMAVANKIFAAQGAGAWPGVSAAHPELFQPGLGIGGFDPASGRGRGSAGAHAGEGAWAGNNQMAGGGNFNPNIKIDTSTTSVAPPRGPIGANIGADITDDGTWDSRLRRERRGKAQRGDNSIFGPTGGAGEIPGSGPGQGSMFGPADVPTRASIPPAPMGFVGGAPPLGPQGPPGPGGPPVGPPIGGPATPPPGPGAGEPVGRSQGQGGWQPSGAGAGADGGALGAAAGAASSALDVIAPGAGQAAQTATKLINRTIQFGGQLAAIGVSGMMETFGLNGSPLGDPSKSWFGRVVSGLAQAKPAVPTSAGGKDKEAAQAKQQQSPGAQQGGPMVNIENFVQAENRNGMQVPHDLAAAAAAAPLKRP